MGTISWDNLNSPVCSTCKYWNGDRDVDTSFVHVEQSCEGECNNSNSGWQGVQKNQQASCNYWKSINS